MGVARGRSRDAGSPVVTDEQRAELEAAGKEFARTERARAAALERVVAAALAARGTVSVREMARLAGVSHVTLYKLAPELRRGGEKA